MESICLSTKTFDLNGYVHLFNIDLSTSDTRSRTRRVSRFATLDGGAYIDDAGYSHGDRTITAIMTGTESIFDALVYLIENYGSMWISLPDGAFTGSLSRVDRSSGKIRATILLEAAA